MRLASAALVLVLPLSVAGGAVASTPAADPGRDQRIEAAARANDMSVEHLTRLLAEDPSLHLAGERLYYADPAPAAPEAAASSAPTAPFPTSETFQLHSRPGSNRTIYLDFNGQLVSDTYWNDPDIGVPERTYGGLDVDNVAGFNASEHAIIQDVWLRVAEDYAPYDVDVTTQDPGSAALTRTSASDQVFGMRALVTDAFEPADVICFGQCIGVAFIDVFDEPAVPAGYLQPAWAFSELMGHDPIQIAETITHEVGHTLGLEHDGQIGGDSYYLGHDVWSPIMGGGWGALTQFSKGEYSNADNTQDDLALIAANGAPYRPDDHGGQAAPTPVVDTAAGVIGRATDQDWFVVETACEGPFTAAVQPWSRGPNLDIRLTVLDQSGSQLASVDPPSGTGADMFEPTGLDASYSATSLPAGSYRIGIDGVGKGTPTSGYSDYGSIGNYALTISAACPQAQAPGLPTSVQVSASSSSATLTWQPPESTGGAAITGYDVALGSGAVSLGPDQRSHTFTGLAPGTAYSLSVLARNSVGVGPAVERSVTTPATRPSAPRIGTASSGADGGRLTAKARWSAPTSTGGSAVTAYRVRALRINASGQVVWKKARTAGASTRSLVWELARGRYRFDVTAVNAVGTGPRSARSNAVRAR